MIILFVMNWFWIALIGPVLYSIANHTDKFLISKYLKGGQVGAIIIFSSLFSIAALPFVISIHPDIFNIGLWQGIALAINGTLVVVILLLYFYALYRDEASYVVPFYQTIPIFGFILGYFILGETITFLQGGASIIIIVGALILSFDIGLNKIRFKKEVVILMLTASFLYAVNGVIFKLIALDGGFWPSLFWGLVGKIIMGIMFLLFVPVYRNQFLAMIRENKVAVLGLTSLSETLFIFGEAVTQYATLLAPVVLVLLVNSFQPLFVFILGILITLFLPQINQESLDYRQVIQKIIGI